ncbi:tail protein [Alteromonas phage vB_AmeM_PT11-V22]|uniref:Baseplate protein n=1 Tax=Alteromonas phage vB_AmeM_PT11-V22 TaxID=2704031 RepID=A0A6C0R0R4_9CAUD|nr:tail protein [Alteromonas phage vB_AmeM_PT11-V22]QHZ59748.1 baseplate protein [Alteromonas phage vB_AmeM_PT11-V22]
MAINADNVKWADQSVNDPVTGLPNKVQPTAEFQNDGLKSGEPLRRDYLNYMFNEHHGMFADLQQQINDLVLTDVGGAVLQQIYHVGAYYMSDSSQSPATRFGFGTWERVRGKFIVGMDEGDSDFNAAGKTGGSKTHSHSNNLSINSAGSHTHEVSREDWGSLQQSQGSTPNLPQPTTQGRLVTGSGRGGDELEPLGEASGDKTTSTSGSHTHTMSGGINSSSNVPPYRAAYIWVRTA